MFLFKTMHYTSIGLLCSVIYRGAAARWSVYKRQMQLGTGNNWEPYVWSDAELTEVGSRKPVAFHGLWIWSTARTHLSTGRWDLPFTHRQWHLTKPTWAACSTSSMQPVLRETQDLLSWKEPIRNIESSSHPCIGQPQNSTHVSKGVVQLLLEQSCCRNTIRGFYLHPALQAKMHLSPAESHTSVSNIAHTPRQCTQATFRQTWPAPQLPGLSGDVCGIRCYFAEDNMKTPNHSASVFKTTSQVKGTHTSYTHTTTSGSISDLFAQLVRSQFVPEQKPQTFG